MHEICFLLKTHRERKRKREREREEEEKEHYLLSVIRDKFSVQKLSNEKFLFYTLKCIKIFFLFSQKKLK